MADFLNTTTKYVASHTAEGAGELTWQPAAPITGNLASELIKLKKQPGKDILVPGSPRLVWSLLKDGLLDRLVLTVCPVVVGHGLCLFGDTDAAIRLTLANSVTLETGAVILTYENVITSERQS